LYAIGAVKRYQDIMISKIPLQKYIFGELEKTEQAQGNELTFAKNVTGNL
jgi:hypothetical protein